MSTNSSSLSMKMLLANLEDSARAVEKARELLATSITDRDDIIRDLVSNGVPRAKVARHARMSRTQLYNVQTAGNVEDTADARAERKRVRDINRLGG